MRVAAAAVLIWSAPAWAGSEVPARFVGLWCAQPTPSEFVRCKAGDLTDAGHIEIQRRRFTFTGEAICDRQSVERTADGVTVTASCRHREGSERFEVRNRLRLLSKNRLKVTTVEDDREPPERVPAASEPR
jgi:hypothetical protein